LADNCTNVAIHDMSDTHYVIFGQQFPPLRNNNQLQKIM